MVLFLIYITAAYLWVGDIIRMLLEEQNSFLPTSVLLTLLVFQKSTILGFIVIIISVLVFILAVINLMKQE